MRIVIDLQAAQSPGSRVRGIGRYSLALAEAMAKVAAAEHEIWIALNHAVADSVDSLRARFEPLVGAERIVVWESIAGTMGCDPAARARRHAAELLRERFLASLAPDVVHVSSLFEGWGDGTVTSVGRWPGDPRQAVTLSDLIPYVRRETYLRDPGVNAWYSEKIGHLYKAGLLMAISEFSRREAIEVLGIAPERVVNISGACDPAFRRLDGDERARLGPAARARHGLRSSFVLYTGGFDDRKNIDGLIRAFAALPGKVRGERQLAIVGHGPEDAVQRLRVLAMDQGLASTDVVFTGYVHDDDLRTLYNLCDLYVFPSFHEGFGLPALEAMACGAVVIGADSTSLPEVIGTREALFDPGSQASMVRLISDCLEQEPLREALRRHSVRQVARFSWTHTAELALSGMSAARARAARRMRRNAEDVPAAAAALSACIDDDADYAALRQPLARALALNMPREDRETRLFVDVTVLADVDVGTGIQRVVRNVLRQWLARAPAGYVIEPVRFDPAVGYVHARAFSSRFSGGDGQPADADRPIDPYPGDIVVGLDLIAHLLPDGREYFRWLRNRGVRLWFVIYDLLPVTRPEFFPPGGLGVFQRWFQVVGELADGVACISRAVAEEFARWLDQVQPARLRPLRIGHFHLGADLHDDAKGTPGVGAGRDPATFLMVGTVERRKGHAQVLAAFERLWSAGSDARLVIVGRPGWLVDDLVAALRAHGNAGERLEWLEEADDLRLRELYATASALLMTSEGEGFGLPLIEAAQHGLPLIARDLPVFREVAGDGAYYFDAVDGNGLADVIERWLDLRATGAAPSPASVSWLTWQQSAEQLLEVVLGGGTCQTWEPDRRYVVGASDPRIATQVGRLDRGRMVADGRPGYLLYGPYSHIAAGSYEVRITLEAPGGRSMARVDLVAFESHETLYLRDLSQESAAPVGERIELVVSLCFARELDAFQVRVFVPESDLTAFVECTLTRVPGHASSAAESRLEPKEQIHV